MRTPSLVSVATGEEEVMSYWPVEPGSTSTSTSWSASPSFSPPSSPLSSASSSTSPPYPEALLLLLQSLMELLIQHMDMSANGLLYLLEPSKCIPHHRCRGWGITIEAPHAIDATLIGIANYLWPHHVLINWWALSSGPVLGCPPSLLRFGLHKSLHVLSLQFIETNTKFTLY